MYKKVLISSIVVALIIILSSCTTRNSEETKIEDNFTLSTIYPDGTEYLSYDNGNTWYSNESECEKPIIYLTVDEKQEYFVDSEFKMFVHSRIDECLNYSNNTYLYYYDGSDWINNPYEKLYRNAQVVLFPNAEIALKKFFLNTDDSQTTYEGMYKIVKEFEGKINGTYICSYVFCVINH